MPGGIEHHTKTALIPIRRLPRRDGGTTRDRVRDRSFQFVDQDLEVHHLGLFACLFRPRRRAIRLDGLEVETDTTVGIPGLYPVATVPCCDLPAEQPTVEVREAFGVCAVETYRRPPGRRHDPHH